MFICSRRRLADAAQIAGRDVNPPVVVPRAPWEGPWNGVGTGLAAAATTAARTPLAGPGRSARDTKGSEASLCARCSTDRPFEPARRST